ncbi:nucleoside transporter [Xylariaceae sp. FL0594]|nr:nucleoside transporter [Xylariaceae sp. FL0594]
MNRIRSLFQKEEEQQEYQPLYENGGGLDPEHDEHDVVPFSWVEYSFFVVLGIAMLWAWNMFFAAASYFQLRFETDDWAVENFPPAISSVSTLSSLTAMAILAKKQHSASYPFRIKLGLGINAAVFVLLTISSKYFLHVAARLYLAFLLFMVSLTACASALLQNGAFAFVACFDRPEYMQAMMAGQGIAGVLPSLVQVVSVLVMPPPEAGLEADAAESDKGTAAFFYFLTAVAVSIVAMMTFVPLMQRHDRIVENRMLEHMAASMTSIEEAERATRKVVSMKTLFRKLPWICSGIFLCFAVTMFFPVITPKILSVAPPKSALALLRPAAFIPLAFFFWNLGDMLGRAFSLALPLSHRPFALFCISIARAIFVPLYFLCNLHGRGAVVDSDLFYLLLVQFPFGLTNGWLVSNCMVAAGEWVDEHEREAAGGFMGLCMVAGLAFGSLLSFTAAGI